MAIPITRAGKNQLVIESPVMPAAGTFGYGNVYRDMVNIEKLGAIVTNPVTYHPRKPAHGTRVVPQESGVLVHTGLPNAGIKKVVGRWRDLWSMLPVPIILHLVGTTVEDVRRSVEYVENVESIAGIELGLGDDLSWDEARAMTQAATKHSEKPILVRVPLFTAEEIAHAAQDGGADGIVISSAPRGTVRDPLSGNLIGGRLYSPTVKPLALRAVGKIARAITDVPLIGAGGIHSPQDARDYLDAGAVAVQVDSVTWVLPRMIEIIGRDLGGWVLTREAGALADEWFTGMGNTHRMPPAHE